MRSGNKAASLGVDEDTSHKTLVSHKALHSMCPLNGSDSVSYCGLGPLCPYSKEGKKQKKEKEKKEKKKEKEKKEKEEKEEKKAEEGESNLGVELEDEKPADQEKTKATDM